MSGAKSRERKAEPEMPPFSPIAAATRTLATGKKTKMPIEPTIRPMDEMTKTSPRITPRRARPMVTRKSRDVPARRAP
jgi:hypothetical protein